MDVPAVWVPFAQVERIAPAELQSWLLEPGLLTARIRALCGERLRFRMLGPLRRAQLGPALQARLALGDADCWLREVEFRCDDARLIFAQTVLPATTVASYPWLRELGDTPIGEVLQQRIGSVEREPLEFAALPGTDPLAQVAVDSRDGAAPAALWARRAIHRLPGQLPILVQEVFLPALLRARGAQATSSEGVAR